MNDSPSLETSAHDLPGQPGELMWFVGIMRRLLAPDGCPWDREQTLETLKPYLIEECYEVLDAIDSGDRPGHREELGDLLLQIVFQAELANFDIQDVIRDIGEKLIHRHPHVFGDQSVADAAEVVTNWDQIKAEEKSDKRSSALDGVARSMPSLHRSYHLARKAAKVGFRWPDAAAARQKVEEELSELDEAVAGGKSDEIAHEAGDLLFATAVWARELGVQPEDALRQAADRFDQRFRAMEGALKKEGTSVAEASLPQLLTSWANEKQRSPGKDGA